MLQQATKFVTKTCRYLSDLALPPLCVSCSALITTHNSLCANCWGRLHLITPPICNRLGMALPGETDSKFSVSSEALAEPPIFHRACAAAHYSGVMRQLIVRFKFEDKFEPVPLFLRMMKMAGHELLAEADLLIPVPLHRFRLLERGFNQSAVLAQGLSRQTSLAVEVEALMRKKRTTPQLGLSQEERRVNVADAFAVKPAYLPIIKGKRVVLIDDVLTTGATLNACAKVLLENGASSVDALAVALVVRGMEENDD